jgi:outer membrane protein TolC
MNYHNIFRLCLGLLLGISIYTSNVFAQQDSVWTLEQCLSAAAQSSPRMIVSSQSIAGAEAAAAEMGAYRWPTIGTSGTYAYTNKTQEMKISLPIPGLTFPPIKFGDGNVYDFAATAKIPIFMGGTLTENTRAGRSALQASQQDYRSDSLRLVYDVRRAYFNAVGAEARADAARQSARRLDRHYQDLLKAKEIGTVSEENRIQALSRLRQAEQMTLTAEGSARSARLALGNLASAPDKEITPASDLNTSLTANTAPDAIAVESRAEVAATNARLQQSRHLIRAAQGSLWPALAGSAAYHYAKPGVDAAANEWMNYYTLGVSATWTLWDSNARHSKVRQVKASERSMEARKQDLLNSLTTRRASALQVLEAARAAFTKVSERADLERQRLAMVEGRQKSGMATESEYLDAQDDLTAAETDLAAAAVQVRLAETDVLNASGY